MNQTLECNFGAKREAPLKTCAFFLHCCGVQLLFPAGQKSKHVASVFSGWNPPNDGSPLGFLLFTLSTRTPPSIVSYSQNCSAGSHWPLPRSRSVAGGGRGVISLLVLPVVPTTSGGGRGLSRDHLLKSCTEKRRAARKHSPATIAKPVGPTIGDGPSFFGASRKTKERRGRFGQQETLNYRAHYGV